MAITQFRGLKSALDITLTGESVSSETHTIPVSSPYEVYLDYVPKINSTATNWDSNTYVSVADMATAGISFTIGGGAGTITASSSPGDDEAYFQIIAGGALRYSTKVTFNSADAGLAFVISYTGWMSLVEKERILRIQEAIERQETYAPCSLLSTNTYSNGYFDNSDADDTSVVVLGTQGGMLQFDGDKEYEYTTTSHSLSAAGDTQVSAFTDVDGFKKIGFWLIDNSGTVEGRITEGAENAVKGSVADPADYAGDAVFCGYIVVEGDGTGAAGGIEVVPQADISGGPMITVSSRGWDSRYYTHNIHDNVDGEISAVAAKGSPTTSDYLLIEDAAASDAKKSITLGDFPSGVDPTAIHDDTSAEISAITEKTTAVGADVFVIEDSAASNAKKRLSYTNLGKVVTYENLNTNGDVGTGSTQVSQGDHTHDGRYYTESEIDTTLADYVPLTFVGTTGGLTLSKSETTANITATATVDIDVDVPTSCLLIGCQLRVDSALATGETWDAEWNDGSSMQAICTNQAVAQNTKVNKFHDANANTPLTDATTKIQISKNGGGSFTAQGTIRAIAYYYAFTAMGDA